jgi:preprotein translocase subunit YajC
MVIALNIKTLVWLVLRPQNKRQENHQKYYIYENSF